MIRMPDSLAIASMRCSRSIPSGPLSRKPPLRITAKGTRFTAHISSTANTPCAGTPITTRSMSSPISAIDP